MKGIEKNSRITVNVEDELFDKIEDFRFENRYQNRSDAIVALLQLGIKELEKESKKNGK